MELTFTLVSGEDDTLVLSYVGGTCTHRYETTVENQPTCTEAGVSNVKCTLCGSPWEYTLAATGHTYVDGVCTVCGAVAGNDYTISFANSDLRTSYSTEQQVWTSGAFVVTNNKSSSTSHVGD